MAAQINSMGFPRTFSFALFLLWGVVPAWTEAEPSDGSKEHDLYWGKYRDNMSPLITIPTPSSPLGHFQESTRVAPTPSPTASGSGTTAMTRCIPSSTREIDYPPQVNG